MADNTTLTAELAARNIKAMTAAIIDAAGGDTTARAGIATLNNTTVAALIARIQTLEAAFRTVSFTAAAYSVPEGNSGTTLLAATMKRTGDLTLPLAVTTRFIAGTLDASDFPNGLPSDLVWNFAAGADTASNGDPIKGDVDFEPSETLTRILIPPAGYSFGAIASYTGNVLNDDTTQPVVISAWPYTDDLEDAAVGSNVMSRPNWSATGANTDTFKVSSAHGMYSSQLYRQNSFIQFGPAITDDFGFEYELDENRSATPGNGRTDAYSNTAQGLYLIYKDADNYLQMGNDGRIGIERTKTAGTETYRGGFFDHGLTTAPDWTAVGSPASRKVRYQVHNGKLRIRGPHDEWMLRASQLKYPFGTYGIDALGGFDTAAGRVGPAVYRTATYVYDTINGVRLRPLKMVVTSHARFCSRRPNSGGTAPENFGRIWVKGDYKGTATRWAYRLLTVPIPKTVAQDWRDCADVVAANGQFSVNCQLPFGFMGEIELAMTDSDGVTHATTTKRVACGKVFLSYGQSNSGGRQGQASGLTAYSQKAACRSYTSDSNSEGIPAFEIAGLGTVEHSFANVIEGARVYADVSGIPCLMAATGIAGSGIANLFAEPNFTNFFGALRNVYDGWIDGVIWDQGEGDRDGLAANTTYFDSLDAGYQKMVTATGNPNLPMWISPIGRFASTNAPSSDKGYTWAQIDGNSKPIFAAYQAMIDKYPGKVRYADSKLGQRHIGTDPYHYTSAAYQSMMRRFARTVLNSEGRAAPDGRGPLVTGVTRSGATLTLALNMNGATGLTDLVSTTTVDNDVAGTPAFQGLYGYQVSTDNFATTVAISSIAVGSDRKSLVIMLSADPGKAVQARSFDGASCDDRQLFWGTYDGGFENVPVFPIYVPLTSN